MEEKRFANLWPTAEKLGWTLKSENIHFSYVTPPDEERQQWGATWTYQKYGTRIVYIPAWFEEELSKDIFKRNVANALKKMKL